MYFPVDQNGQFSSKNAFGSQFFSYQRESDSNRGPNPRNRSHDPNAALAPFDYKPPKSRGAKTILVAAAGDTAVLKI